ncbi:MAG: restriction endonuclease [Bdellovibrionaceae bacterium]|nr:restriction endonuclease [Pseudobdellovibrionaceae bacterium]
MAIPSFRSFLRPVLEIMAEINEVSNPRAKLVPIVKEKMGFSDEEAAERLESGGNRLQNRVGWALTYLKKSGLIESPKRGVATITESGRNFLNEHDGPISPKDLEVFPGYLEFKAGNKNNEKNGSAEPETDIDEIDPEEKINMGFKEIKNSVIDELQEKLLELTPTQFEELVLNLIQALGYGIQTGKIEHTGGSGDFGIDGIVHLDKLGLDKIYLQAKRYKPSNKISSSEIQKFFGALKGRHASKGIFLTTSSYQPSALEYAQTVSDTLVLLDGRQIAEHMIDAKVGVSAKRKIIIPEIDNDYFDN